MQEEDEAFLKILLETFALEAKEHIEILSNGLLELENDYDAKKSIGTIETLFREAHSLKGAARSVNIREIEELCKAIEDVFGKYKKSGEKIAKELIEEMLKSVDLLTLLANATPEVRATHKPKVREQIKRLTEPLKEIESVEEIELATEEISKKEKEIDETPKVNAEVKTIRVPVEKLNSIMLQSEEMLFAKIVSQRHLTGIQKILIELQSSQKPDLKKLKLMLLKEIEVSQSNERLVNIMVDKLLDEMKQALMLPFSTLFFALPKSVHDMAISVSKEVMLKVEGGETQIDRRILEEMKDPLMHILRNAIDHGIETPQVRVNKNKPAKGLITILLKQEDASKVSITVRDDGAGIDKKRLLDSALKKEIISQDEYEHIDSEDILALIFHSGVTTSKIVSDLSGRGLGLAIVKEKTQGLGGDVSVRNLEDGGCEFSMILPLSLSTFRGVLVAVDEHRLIFPSVSVERVVEISVNEIRTIEGRETYTMNGKVITFALLREVLSLDEVLNDAQKVISVIVKFGETMMAIGVDEVLYEDEVMIKSMGKQLLRVKNISGVALLSSDKPALILNIQDIFKSVGKSKSGSVSVHKDRLDKKRKLLVVDDSPTTRILLKNVLEIAGYDVVSANDGLEAFNELKKGGFDLLVSDIEMPKMNGFELTQSVREDKVLSELPIVLVTALESPEDKQKGMEAGANAYIVKSSFNQSNLMETIKWLIK